MRKQYIERHFVFEEETKRRQIIGVKARYGWPWFEKIKQTIFIKSTVRPSTTFVRFDPSRLISTYPHRKHSRNTRHSKVSKIPDVCCFLQHASHFFRFAQTCICRTRRHCIVIAPRLSLLFFYLITSCWLC